MSWCYTWLHTYVCKLDSILSPIFVHYGSEKTWIFTSSLWWLDLNYSIYSHHTAEDSTRLRCKKGLLKDVRLSCFCFFRFLSGTNTSVLRMNVHYGDRFENAFFDGIGFYCGNGWVCTAYQQKICFCIIFVNFCSTLHSVVLLFSIILHSSNLHESETVKGRSETASCRFT